MKGRESLPLTSSHWGTYRVQTNKGKVVALHGFEQDDDVSPIGEGIIDVLEGTSRIHAPVVRKSWLQSGAGANTHKRGAEPFVAISWERAEELVAKELNRVIGRYGNKAIYAGSYGWSSAGRFHHAQSQIHRFLNCIGGYTRSVNTYSFAAAEVIVAHVLGDFYSCLASATSWPSIIEHTQLLVAFGGMPLKNGQINSGGVGRHTQRENLLKAQQNGVSFVNVSPIRSDVEALANAKWLAPRPNTDTAVLLALAWTLYANNLYDQAFIGQYTTGFTRFLRYLKGEKDGVCKDARWAAQISGLSAQDILNLAKSMAGQRTIISVSWSLTRQDHGEQIYWAAIALAAMLGQVGLPGGGIGFGYSATNSIGDHNTKIPAASLPQGSNPVDDFIPVARLSDLLLCPGQPFEYNGQTGNYPDTHIVYWAGGNPFHHHQDINQLLRAWHKPDTVIVHDWCWNSLAKHADIVLPCTTPLERNDIAFSPRDPYVVAMQKVIAPPGYARNDYDILTGIAARMGVAASFTEYRDEAGWLAWIYANTLENARQKGIPMPDYAQLKEDGWYVPPQPLQANVLFEAFRSDPLANPLDTPSGKIELFSATIENFGYQDCPGHPTWIEPLEWLGSGGRKYPLHLISNQPKNRLHSQLDHGSYSRAAKIGGREPVSLCSTEARKRSLCAGDIVKIYNDRGACLAGVVIDDAIRAGVVQMSTGAWYDPLEPGRPGTLCKHGNVNVLTPDKGTSRLAQGPIAQTCLVEIEKFTGELPPVTAFDPPVVIDNGFFS